jgi:hypothetical protein
MKLLLLIPLLYLMACGSGSEKSNKAIIGNPQPQTEPVSEVVIIATEAEVPEAPKMPKGAVNANFKADQIPFYAHVKSVNKRKGITTIAFEENKAPALVLNDTYGATVSMLRFDEFDRDLLLVNSKIKDPQFHKYHLYILKKGYWLPVVKPFSIHESHVNASLKPIVVDPKNSDYMFRYYSVFDIDETSDLGYTWRLFNESVGIINE